MGVFRHFKSFSLAAVCSLCAVAPGATHAQGVARISTLSPLNQVANPQSGGRANQDAALIIAPQQAKKLAEHASRVRWSSGSDYPGFVADLLRPARSDIERAYLVYRWVGNHFRHSNSAARRLGNPDRHEVSVLLDAGAGSCEVFASVVQRLLVDAGLHVSKVAGVAKGFAAPVNGANHVWNVVELHGRPFLLDATWGGGFLDNGRFVKQLDDSFFMVPMERAVLSHFDPQDQYGVQARFGINAQLFHRLPDDASYLHELGLSTESILNFARRGGGNYLRTYETKSGAVRLLKGPVGAVQSRKHLALAFEATGYDELVVNQGGKWLPMQQDARYFSIDFKPQAGELWVMGRRKGQLEYEAILSYAVR